MKNIDKISNQINDKFNDSCKNHNIAFGQYISEYTKFGQAHTYAFILHMIANNTDIKEIKNRIIEMLSEDKILEDYTYDILVDLMKMDKKI